jgi:radical SAM superfamily enzyme YgiQ (UPF0313 family)
MLGLPGETEEDVTAIGSLASAIGQQSGGRIVAGVSPFVPKAQTPFQRVAMLAPRELRRRLSWLQKDLRRRGFEVRTESVPWSEVQAVLARGDRRLAQVLLQLEGYSTGAWKAAMSHQGLSAAAYTKGLASGAPPWAHIQSGLSAGTGDMDCTG